MEKELKGGSQEKKGAFEKNFLRFILNDFFNSNTWLILIIYLLKKHEWCNQRWWSNQASSQILKEEEEEKPPLAVGFSDNTDETR